MFQPSFSLTGSAHQRIHVNAPASGGVSPEAKSVFPATEIITRSAIGYPFAPTAIAGDLGINAVRGAANILPKVVPKLASGIEWTASKSIAGVQEVTRRAAGYAYHGAAAPIQGGYEIGKSALVNGTHMAIDLGFKPAIAAPFNATRGAALAVLGGLTLPGQVLGRIPGFGWMKSANDALWDGSGNAFNQSVSQIAQPFKGESWRPAADFAQSAWAQTAITAGRMAYAPTQVVAPEWGQKHVLGTAVNIAQGDGSLGAAFGSAQDLKEYNRNKMKTTIGKLPGFGNAANNDQYAKAA